jgi:hypothetical protein
MRTEPQPNRRKSRRNRDHLRRQSRAVAGENTEASCCAMTDDIRKILALAPPETPGADVLDRVRRAAGLPGRGPHEDEALTKALDTAADKMDRLMRLSLPKLKLPIARRPPPRPRLTKALFDSFSAATLHQPRSWDDLIKSLGRRPKPRASMPAETPLTWAARIDALLEERRKQHAPEDDADRLAELGTLDEAADEPEPRARAALTKGAFSWAEWIDGLSPHEASWQYHDFRDRLAHDIRAGVDPTPFSLMDHSARVYGLGQGAAAEWTEKFLKDVPPVLRR